MQTPIDHYEFQVIPLFQHIKQQAVKAGVYLYHNNAKETLQMYKNEESYRRGDKYIGAIQYEGSLDYAKKEPHLVSFQFKRDNLSDHLKQKLEAITPFRRYKYKGPAVNPEAESIAFKFEKFNEEAAATVSKIMGVLHRYVHS